MPEYKKLMKLIATQTGTKFRAASSPDLAELRALRLPGPVVDFYARHEPSECAEGQVRLWPIADVLRENRDLIPGAYVAPLGYVVFATTLCGDAYCFDVNVTSPEGEPRIVLISHEAVRKDITAERAQQLAKSVARDLHEFLEKFEQIELDEECVY
ncbi:hypothetical protein GobsT_69750 [Gemmata obscuriglobus]|uniref:SMI1/KNR4 family protein n=1 Tax=Gemmata obscuriglobus TaxID=114 RepID=A0A2Z3HBX1_9BACT|nr:SMI1/KNR4 family protein [Gemmata obscuriglobus]AWM41902.1 SMI1/KNR4 family protein [Gemmata obscuriglobus]QEG32124.1 hypothetical protein GobsT_69750 [Gemmata obscuriglobus]VTS11477.1 Uncharacterized protein OS=Clostridium sp. Maddingley MBC34-26 GN=A370_02306 PE=4 SV=1 [Gemmata obscuriglobus UQM 2246]